MQKKNLKPNRIFIKGINLDKFKSFGKKTNIELSPMINLIFGKNSSGKSSILQALRLIRQSYAKDQLTPFNLESPDKYKDNGGIDIDIQYKGIISDNKESENLKLGIDTGVLSSDGKKFLNSNKEINYEYRYVNKFYKGKKQLIKDKVLLKSLNVKNQDNSIEFSMEFPKANKFDESGDIAYNLSNNQRYQSKEIFKKDINYKSLYSPYYYNINLKNLEIENLKKIYTEFKKNKKNCVDLLKKILQLFNKKNIEDIKKLNFSQIDKNIKKFDEAGKIKDNKKRIEQLNKYQDSFARYFVITRVNFGLREYSDKELIEISKEIKNFIKFSESNFSYNDFKKYIFLDCSMKVKRGVYYMGNFFSNPEKKFQKYRSSNRYNFVNSNLESKILYIYDFIVEILNYYSSSDTREYKVLEIFRSFMNEEQGPFTRSLRGNAAYNDLNICMEKMFIIPGLRSMPKRYFAKGIQTSYIGARAENLAETLANPEISKDTNKWLKKLEIPYSVKVVNVENHYEIIWKPNNKKISIYQNHIGLGYPLILPFIVQCLTAKNKIIVVEEPEVHLHPKLQADLGDLIVESSIKNDNQIILETHSEDLLLRLLKKVRDKKIPPKFISANYVLKDGQKPSEVKKIIINSDGQYFTPWKDDIFAERLKEFE